MLPFQMCSPPRDGNDTRKVDLTSNHEKRPSKWHIHKTFRRSYPVRTSVMEGLYQACQCIKNRGYISVVSLETFNREFRLLERTMASSTVSPEIYFSGLCFEGGGVMQ